MARRAGLLTCVYNMAHNNPARVKRAPLVCNTPARVLRVVFTLRGDTYPTGAPMARRVGRMTGVYNMAYNNPARVLRVLFTVTPQARQWRDGWGA